MRTAPRRHAVLRAALLALLLVGATGAASFVRAAEVFEAPEAASQAWLPVLNTYLSGPCVAAAAPWNAPGQPGDSAATRLGRLLSTARGAALAQPLIGTLTSAGVDPARFAALSDQAKKTVLGAALQETQSRLSSRADALLSAAAQSDPASAARALGRMADLGSVYLDPQRLGSLLVAQERARRAAVLEAGDELAAAFGAPRPEASPEEDLAGKFAEGLARFHMNDFEGKARWARLFAQAGLPQAQAELGILSQSGLGTRRDVAAGRALLLKAARQGYVPAMNMLAYQYKMGFGMAQDPVEAYAWYAVAHAFGDQGASAMMLDELSASLTPAQLEKAKSRARRLVLQLRPGLH